MIFEDHGMAIPGQIRSRFARTCSRIEITSNTSPGLRSAQALTILCFTDCDIACGQVEENGRARQSSIAAQRDWRPKVFADLNRERQSRDVCDLVDEIVAERNPL